MNTPTKLRRSLGLFDAFSIGVNAIIGAGIFVVIGIAAGAAGPALIISVIIGFFISALTATSFIQLSKKIPREGGAYEFIHELMPPPIGFISGWLWVFSNTIAGAAVAIGFAQYLSFLIPTFDPRIYAVIVSVFFTVVNYYSVKASALLGNAINVLKLGILFFFIILGVFFVRVDNFLPFAPNGANGVLGGASLIFFAFTGFARITTVSEEVKNPEKTVPRATVLSLVVSAFIYLLVVIVAIGLVGAPPIAGSGSPLADAIAVTGFPVAVFAITIGALIATSGVLLTSVLGVSRVMYAMAKNGDLPSFLGKIHLKRGVPFYAILVSGALMTLLAATNDLALVVNVSNVSSLLYYALSNASAIRLKVNHKMTIISIMGVISCLVLLFFLTLQSLVLTFAIVTLGLGYYLTKRRDRKIRRALKNENEIS
jgi:APA family basic amino acid/polyamine antiporter